MRKIYKKVNIGTHGTSRKMNGEVGQLEREEIIEEEEDDDLMRRRIKWVDKLQQECEHGNQIISRLEGFFSILNIPLNIYYQT